MGVRTYYLQSLAGEPLSCDLTSAYHEFDKDKAAWRDRVVTEGLGRFADSLQMAITVVVFDALATIKAAFEWVCIHYIFDLSSFKNFAFCAWNLTFANTALVLSVFVGILVPSSREFAVCIRKGDVNLPLFERKETAKQVEEKLAAKPQ